MSNFSKKPPRDHGQGMNRDGFAGDGGRNHNGGPRHGGYRNGGGRHKFGDRNFFQDRGFHKRGPRGDGRDSGGFRASDGGDRPPRFDRDFDSRPPRDDVGEHRGFRPRPSRDDDRRPPRFNRDFDRRPPRDDAGEHRGFRPRPPRDDDRRPPRFDRDFDHRPPRDDAGGHRGFRPRPPRDGGDRPPRFDRDFDRRPTRDDAGDHRGFRPRPPRDDDRRPPRFDRDFDRRPPRDDDRRPIWLDSDDRDFDHRPSRDEADDRDFDGRQPRDEADDRRGFRPRPPRRPPPPIQRVEPEPPVDWAEESVITVSCARGLQHFVSRELNALGMQPTEVSDTTVTLRGTLRDAMMLNLWLRTATRVLWRVGHGYARTLSDLYDFVTAIPWERFIPEDGYFTVGNATHQDAVRDTRLPSLCAKDAIADRFRAACGRRPDSGGETNGAAVFVWWQDNHVEVYLDTTGEPLSRRGYRLQPWRAPMQETLAAACISALEWDPATPFVAPMCGSGTPAIEAALIASNRAPGILREHFSFMSLRGFADGPAADWEAMRERAREHVRTEGLPEIVATDIAPEAIEAAKANANRAGVLDLIRFDTCDFEETPVPEGPGAIFMNPEYGERMGEASSLVETYRRVGSYLKRRAAGYSAGILTGNLDLARKIGLHSLKRLVLKNGQIDCRLLLFRM